MIKPSTFEGMHAGNAQRMRTQMSPLPSWSTCAGFIVPARRSDVIEHVIDEEGILLDPRSEHTLQLNRTALAVWHQCDGKMSTEEIARVQTDLFDIDRDTALHDVEQLIALFAEAGLLESGVES